MSTDTVAFFPLFIFIGAGICRNICELFTVKLSDIYLLTSASVTFSL